MKRLARKMRADNGQAVILVALSLTGILGFVALATDVGTLLHAKRNLQIAADSAAIAGAVEIDIGGSVPAAAAAAATQNGVTSGSNGATVTINYPPAYGPNAGKAGYVEAIVQQNEPTFFMNLFSIASMNVAARAVAFNGATSGTACVYALNQTASDTIHLQGSFNVSVPGCQVIDDSNSPNALYFTGAGGTLTAGGVGVVGGTGGQTGDSTPAPVTGIAPVSDPLSYLTPPTYSPSSCTAVPTGTTWGPTTAGGTVCYSGNIVVQNNVTLNPGVYVITGSLDFTGGGSLTGTGVTFYIAPGGSLGGSGNGNTTLNLTAPTSGPYNGILIYQDPSNTNTIELNGTPITNFSGIVYAPSAELELSGNTTMNLTTDLIVGSLYDKGNATINITDYTKTISTAPLKTVALVE